MKIIAEVGSNWRTYDDCKSAIGLAKNCGAWAVKFQAFNAMALYGTQGAMVNELPQEWLGPLSQKAKAFGIEFMCTAFSPELAEMVNPFVNVHKIASSDLTHKRLLEKINSFKKPVLVSTGGHGLEPKDGRGDVAMALKHLSDCDVTLMYCVSSYPARFVNFERMEFLKQYGRPIGYSDHSTDIAVIPVEAKRRGAVYLEKHVNFTEHQDTPDAPHSLNCDEFKLMCKAAKGEPLQDSFGENDMALMHNRRLIAIRNIQAGERLQEGVNFGAYRSLKPDQEGLSPWLMDRVNGEACRVDVKMGEPITPKAAGLS